YAQPREISRPPTPIAPQYPTPPYTTLRQALQEQTVRGPPASRSTATVTAPGVRRAVRLPPLPAPLSRPPAARSPPRRRTSPSEPGRLCIVSEAGDRSWGRTLPRSGRERTPGALRC